MFSLLIFHFFSFLSFLFFSFQVTSTGCKCAAEMCVEVTSDTAHSRGGKSSNLDSKSQIAGLYPSYFTDAVKYIKSKIQMAESPIALRPSFNFSTVNKSLILLIERVLTTETIDAERSRAVHILNHQELLRVLRARFGADRVVNTNLDVISFGDQVQMFGQAQVIIGQHGAGLTNVLFAQPSAFLLELCPRLHSMVSNCSFNDGFSSIFFVLRLPSCALLYVWCQYQHLSMHLRMVYAFQDDCTATHQQKMQAHGGATEPFWSYSPTVDIDTAIRAVEVYLNSTKAGQFN